MIHHCALVAIVNKITSSTATNVYFAKMIKKVASPTCAETSIVPADRSMLPADSPDALSVDGKLCPPFSLVVSLHV